MNCLHPVGIRNPAWPREWDELHGDKLEWRGVQRYLSVPCGRCIACRIQRTREWTVRLMCELEDWDNASFITLTYDDDHLKDASLHKDDLQRFFKRLRRDLDDRRIKYYACGEYGETTLRPHYHAIVFGLDPIYDHDLVSSNWSDGFVKVGSVTKDSCRYVAGYVQKKLYGNAAEEYESRGVIAPFSCCSKHLGENWCMDHEDYLLDVGGVRIKGKNFGFPRYFKKKLLLDKSFFLEGTLERQQEEIDMMMDKYTIPDPDLVPVYKVMVTEPQRERNIVAQNQSRNKI